MRGVHGIIGGGQYLGRAAQLPIGNTPTVPSSRIIVPVRLDEKSSQRATASLTLFHPVTA